jgi:hypothetical protein
VVCAAVDVRDWTPGVRAAGQRWMYRGEVDVTDEVAELVYAQLPHGLWDFVCDTFGREWTIARFKEAAELQVASGYTGELSKLAFTFPEQLLRGYLMTLLAVWSTQQEVPFIVRAHMRLSHFRTQVALLRNAAYIVNGGILWPDFEPNVSAWWAADVVLPTRLRTAELVAISVFDLV